MGRSMGRRRGRGLPHHPRLTAPARSPAPAGPAWQRHLPPARSPAPRSRSSGLRIRAREVGERGDVGGLQLVLRRAVMAGDPVARRRPVGAPGPPNTPRPAPPGTGTFARQRRGREREVDVGGLQLVLRRAVKAGDPVARRRPVGAPGPPNNANAGEKGLLCQRLGRWGGRCAPGGGVVAVPGTGPIAGTGRPGLAPAPSPARPGTAVAVWSWRWLRGFGRGRQWSEDSRAGGRRERGRRGSAAGFAAGGEGGRPGSSAPSGRCAGAA